MTTRYNQHKARASTPASYIPGNAPAPAELELAKRRRQARVRSHRQRAKGGRK